MFGIAEGRISRLTVYPDRQKVVVKSLVHYERGWAYNRPPEDIKIREIIEEVVWQFDHKAVDWLNEAMR